MYSILRGNTMSKTTLSGVDIKLIPSDILPARTMVVSPDLYDLFTNDGAAAKAANAGLLTKAEDFSRLVKATEARRCPHGLRMNQSCFDCMSVLHGAKP
jgi:hypothetical protein